MARAKSSRVKNDRAVRARRFVEGQRVKFVSRSAGEIEGEVIGYYFDGRDYRSIVRVGEHSYEIADRFLSDAGGE